MLDKLQLLFFKCCEKYVKVGIILFSFQSAMYKFFLLFLQVKRNFKVVRYFKVRSTFFRLNAKFHESWEHFMEDM